jgi:hypothetical protein
MRFYDQQHGFYCGVDLHTRRMYLCILDREGNKQLHRNMRAKPHEFLRAVEPFREDLIVGVATNLRSVPDVYLVLVGRSVHR